ncbi:hypothetical protein PCANC_10610 [Puccinia coronata f. sp. avenae]|uniref:Uncharacterized protein n=1 Tax=Puccinia coronata f. sp. avenae TaxID=200324 RepID=A0A2N5VR73_9BASI|nr:hypothetical protein PCANC_10610 [Puccinia coronata f. sp. avenae]
MYKEGTGVLEWNADALSLHHDQLLSKNQCADSFCWSDELSSSFETLWTKSTRRTDRPTSAFMTWSLLRIRPSKLHKFFKIHRQTWKDFGRSGGAALYLGPTFGAWKTRSPGVMVTRWTSISTCVCRSGSKDCGFEPRGEWAFVFAPLGALSFKHETSSNESSLCFRTHKFLRAVAARTPKRYLVREGLENDAGGVPFGIKSPLWLHILMWDLGTNGSASM